MTQERIEELENKVTKLALVLANVLEHMAIKDGEPNAAKPAIDLLKGF